jgi:hypothetical protein
MPSPASTIFCPGCGVAVTVGYTRCPRCHAPMPSARLKRESMQAGGTSVAEEAGPGRGVWIAAAVLLLAGVIIVAIVALSGGKRTAAAADDGDVEEELTPNSAAAPIEEPLPAPVPPVRLDPTGALDRLERTLANERLFAKGALHGAVVEMRSEFCARERLRAIVAAAVEDLRAQGLTMLHCVELHGAEVFTQPL